MFKKIIVVSVVACVALVTAACSSDAEDVCEKINDECSSRQGFQKQDCSKSNDDYDKLSDADKEKADKVIDCVDDADSCDAILACALSAGGTGG